MNKTYILSLLLIFWIAVPAWGQIWPMHDVVPGLGIGLEEIEPGLGIKKRTQSTYASVGSNRKPPTLQLVNEMNFDRQGTPLSSSIEPWESEYSLAQGAELDTVHYTYDENHLPIQMLRVYSDAKKGKTKTLKRWKFQYNSQSQLKATSFQEGKIGQGIFAKADTTWELRGFEWRDYEEGKYIRRRYGQPDPTCSYLNDPVCWDTLWEKFTYNQKGLLVESRGPIPDDYESEENDRILRYYYNELNLIARVEEIWIYHRKRGEDQKLMGWAQYEYEFWDE